MIKIDFKNLNAFFGAVSKNYPLFAPLKRAGETNYGFYGEGDEVDLKTLKTVKSPKDAFFPQSENMMKFKTSGKNIEIKDIRSEKQPFVLFGVRACDLKAFSALDHVFLQEPVDTYYKSRREAGIIFTLACGKPEESCFCNGFGVNAAEPEGDATCYLGENCLYIKANTQKAQAVLESDKVKAVISKADGAGEKEVEEIKKTSREITEKLPYSHLDVSVFKPENLNELFNLPVWGELSESCLGCGACTFVCPTCQCFDIRDFKGQNGITRFRCWDSCMYSDFTQMAAANSRPTQMQRYRQRFMHKLVYFPSQYGMYSCVGCGRCVKKCPQHLNIIKVIKKINGEGGIKK